MQCLRRPAREDVVHDVLLRGSIEDDCLVVEVFLNSIQHIEMIFLDCIATAATAAAAVICAVDANTSMKYG